MGKIEKDGGTAFPFVVPSPERFQCIEQGMTLRDYFAGQALTFLDHKGLWEMSQDKDVDLFELLADISYSIADAMIKKRNK